MLHNVFMNVQPGITTRSELEKILGHPDKVGSNVLRGGFTGSQLFSYDAAHASVYVKDDVVVLIICSPGPATGFPAKISDWEKELGPPEAILPSFRGKHQRVYAYPKVGLAPHVNVRTTVQVVEVFETMSLAEYQAKLYKPAPKFIK